MAIDVCKSPRSGATSDVDNGWTIWEEYVVKVDDANETVDDIYDAVIAVSGTSYTGSSGSLADLQNVELTKSSQGKLIWIAKVNFNSRSSGFSTLYPDMEVSIDFVDVSVPFVKGYTTGDPRGTPSVAVVNTAKQPFDPPLTKMVPAEQITIIIEENNLNHVSNANLLYTINNASFALLDVTYDPLTLLMRGFQARKTWNSGNAKWTKTYVLAYRSETWAIDVQDRGTKVLNGSGEQIPYYQNGVEFTEPFFLTSGSFDDPSVAGFEPDILTFNPYWTADWSGLDFPASS